MVTDIQNLLDPNSAPDEEPPEEVELVHLWDPDLGPVDAGVNHADHLEQE